MRYLGIDSGLHGALAILDDKGRALVFDTPVLTIGRKGRAGKIKEKPEYNLRQMFVLLKQFVLNSAVAMIELSKSRPGQGVVSMETIGYGRGAWEMALTALEIPYTRVTPQKWKRAVLVGVGHEKEGAVLRATQLYPHIEFTTPRGAVLDGRADALMIATYCRQFYDDA